MKQFDKETPVALLKSEAVCLESQFFHCQKSRNIRQTNTWQIDKQSEKWTWFDKWLSSRAVGRSENPGCE